MMRERGKKSIDTKISWLWFTGCETISENHNILKGCQKIVGDKGKDLKDTIMETLPQEIM